MLAIVKADGRKIPLGDESVQMVCTSPPYWNLRKYAGEQDLIWGGRDCKHEWSSKGRRPPHPDRSTGDHDGKGSGIFVDRIERGSQAAKKSRGEAVELGNTCVDCGAWRGAYGLEPTVNLYVQHTVEILREIRRVLRDDGVVFWNIGDSYNAGRDGGWPGGKKQWKPEQEKYINRSGSNDPLLKPKDLCLIPFRVALAAQADGWWVRSDIIWAKPNPMPESVTDRPTRSHEYILMLTKSAKYYWDADAVREPHDDKEGPVSRFGNIGSKGGYQGGFARQCNDENVRPSFPMRPGGRIYNPAGHNIRSVWTFTTEPYPEAHFATFPEELPKRCILAATKLGDLVLDPFAGSGTVGKVAIELGRRAILCDLAYQDLASKRTAAIQRPLIALQGELSG